MWVHDDPVTGYVVIDGEAIATTPGHPFFTLERGWVAASELRVGEHLPAATSGAGVVGSVSWLRGPDRMYDLTVDRAHTFFVGDGGWLVHNCGGRGVPYLRNRSDWGGDTHVYAIRDAAGRILQIGESATGVTRNGISRRAQQQVSKLQRRTGGQFSSEIRRTFPSKAQAVSYQTQLIDR